MYDLAPGNVLQNMYLKNRLPVWCRKGPMAFLEVGAGSGRLSNILLNAGMSGMGFDLNAEACEINRARNRQFIESGKYRVMNADFFELSDLNPVDVILSSMVIEHLPPDKTKSYFEKCRSLLKTGGRVITLVPASMRHWGIEDEIAGHYKRYEFSDFKTIGEKHFFKLEDLTGLTFPLSNWLFGISNRIIRRNESWKKELSMDEKTKLSASGPRNIKFKTTYPSWFRFLVNEVTMYPFYGLQLLFRNHESSMVIYCELSKP